MNKRNVYMEFDGERFIVRLYSDDKLVRTYRWESYNTAGFAAAMWLRDGNQVNEAGTMTE